MSFRDSVKHWFFGFPPWTRALLFVALLVVSMVLIFSFGTSVRDRLSRWSFSRNETRLIEAKQQAEERARIAEGKATIADNLLREKNAEIVRLTDRAIEAEASLRRAQAEADRSRKRYDEIRNRPFDIAAPGPDAVRLCADLAALGYRCQ